MQIIGARCWIAGLDDKRSNLKLYGPWSGADWPVGVNSFTYSMGTGARGQPVGFFAFKTFKLLREHCCTKERIANLWKSAWIYTTPLGLVLGRVSLGREVAEHTLGWRSRAALIYSLDEMIPNPHVGPHRGPPEAVLARLSEIYQLTGENNG
jgi:hypothetical protein